MQVEALVGEGLPPVDLLLTWPLEFSDSYGGGKQRKSRRGQGPPELLQGTAEMEGWVQGGVKEAGSRSTPDSTLSATGGMKKLPTKE